MASKLTSRRSAPVILTGPRNPRPSRASRSVSLFASASGVPGTSALPTIVPGELSVADRVRIVVDEGLSLARGAEHEADGGRPDHEQDGCDGDGDCSGDLWFHGRNQLSHCCQNAASAFQRNKVRPSSAWTSARDYRIEEGGSTDAITPPMPRQSDQSAAQMLMGT